jgi:hypothetical protein
LKIKSFELERLGMAHEQALEDVRKLKMENDVLTKKAALLKKEYYTLESEAKSQRAELDQQIRTLSATMRSYEGHEMEGQLSIAGKTPILVSLSCMRPTEKALTPTGGRPQSTVVLTHQLMQKQGELEQVPCILDSIARHCCAYEFSAGRPLRN